MSLAPRDASHYLRPGTLQLSALPPLALYVHLPWCLQKCPYCDFNSHAAPAEGAPASAYLQALMADLECSLPLIWGRMVNSIFIGGGTPSLFAPDAIHSLISQLRARLRLAPDCEITLEANPGTFERQRFKAFREAGVTRLSIGVQSFNDAHLKALGRVHDSAQALAAAEEAAQTFETFNLDLMYALPGQSLAQLAQDLDTALALQAPHLSIYHLTLEPNTYFAKFPPRLPDEDTAYDMLDHIVDHTARRGLQRYEISAFAQPGHRCWHNTNYWQFGDYLGIGAGAHSKLSFAHRVVRQVRLRDPALYMQHSLRGQPLASDQDVPRSELPFEFMLNALRLRDGVASASFSERTGLPWSTLQAGLAEARRLGYLNADPERLQASDKGFDFLSDLQALFLPDTQAAAATSSASSSAIGAR